MKKVTWMDNDEELRDFIYGVAVRLLELGYTHEWMGRRVAECIEATNKLRSKPIKIKG